MKTPKKWKMALLTWICIYPLINIIFITVMPVIGSWHPLLKTLLTTIILVPLMGLSIELLRKQVGDWLYK
ncbi:hypothetical protein [Mucilaginibacter pineti]|nr:hypothetical protein [Mucilaginibacter pineti]